MTLLSSKSQYLDLIYLKNVPKMRMSEKCCNNNKHNNSDNPLTSRRTEGGKNSTKIIAKSVLQYSNECSVHLLPEVAQFS